MINLPLRPFQSEALEALSQKKHVICVAATGSGKSLIYEQFAAAKKRRTVLVTPLRALAHQQYRNALNFGINAALGVGPTGSMPPTIDSKGSGMWIISPEKLFSPDKKRALGKLKEWRPNFLVVDECHCLWEWGEEFRPAYRAIPELIRGLKIDTSLWLTATLPPAARADLKSSLPSRPIEIGNFSIPNNLGIHAKRLTWGERIDALIKIINAEKSAGIVFAWTRANTERIRNLIEAAGHRCMIYHAGMSAEERLISEKLIREQKIDVVVATSAFGMGMNYAHLKWAVIWQAAPSLLALAQAIGRVGRSEGAAKAWLFWSPEDFRLIEWIVGPSERRKQDLFATLNYLEDKRCRVISLSEYFSGIRDDRSCGRCDHCID